jgi:hypothetical protein
MGWIRGGLLAPTMLLLIAARPVAGQGTPNTLTKQEVADGWLLLFDGETTFGWQKHGDATWRVVDGTLTCSKGTGGWLATTTEFADFVLRCRYRVSPKGDSGIFFRAKPTDRPGVGGYEMQIRDDGEAGRTGDIVGRLRSARPSGKPVPAAGTWQDVEIRAEGDHIQVTLNGVKVVDGRDASLARGCVGLEYHQPDMKLEFRDVRLKPLGLASIFNGRDLSGWEILPGLPSKFSVKPGEILHIQGGKGQIATTSMWGDFALQLDVKTGGPHQNSGVFFRSEPGVRWIGYEAQIRNEWRDNDRSKPVDYGTGAIYNRQPARKVYSNDLEWFTMTVIAHGPHLATWVNGCQAADWTDTRPRSRNPRRGYRPEAGVISLQGHDPTTDLSFRNIRIVEYPKAASK